MKTQVIQLETHDDVLSVRDKMTWGQTGRILLVWPKRGGALQRRLDLILLQRHAAANGAQLALVTRQADVRHHAAELGIPVFESTRQAQTARWRKPRRRLPRRPAQVLPPRPNPQELRAASPHAHLPRPLPPALRLGLFALSMAALLAVAALLAPGAEIALTPAERSQSISLPLSASPDVETINLSGSLPAYWVTVTVEGRDSITATGVTRVPSHAASGSVTFTNLTEAAVVIPQGTRVAALGEQSPRFIVTQSGQVAAGVGQTVTLPVVAAVPGRGGNLPANSLQAIEGPLGLRLTVRNAKPTSGGDDLPAAAPTAGNRVVLYNQLAATLRQTALAEIQQHLAPGDVLLSHDPAYTIIEKIYTPASNDQPAERLQLTLRLEVTALIASGEDIRELMLAVLDAQLPADYAPLPETLSIENVSAPELDRELTARWTVSARRQLRAQISPAKAIGLALGLPPPQAEQRLAQTLPLASAPRIALIPAWWPRLPFIPFRIAVKSED